MADNTNPGNFANRSKEEVQAAAQKGGQTTGVGGFANMDPDKQVNMHRTFPCVLCNDVDSAKLQKEIASKGGQASSGSFEPGSEKAKEAGRKGGSLS